MIDFNDISKKYIKKHNSNINNWRLLIWKNKCITYLIIQQPNFEKIYLYAKDPYEAKCQLLISKRDGMYGKYL